MSYHPSNKTFGGGGGGGEGRLCNKEAETYYIDM